MMRPQRNRVFDRSCAIILAILALCATAQSTQAQNVSEAHAATVTVDGDKTQFILTLSSVVPFRQFLLPNPARVVVDLPNVTFSLPQGTGSTGKGLISAFRFGLFAPGKSRIVIDTTGPVQVRSARMYNAEGNAPARLVLDMVSTDPASFQRQIDEHRRADAPKSAPKAAELPLNARNRKVNDKPIIVIDPGHGGIDTGAIGASGTPEKMIVLKFAQALKAKLDETEKFQVHLTRATDVFIALGERVQIARQLGADLFISIHADSVPRNWRRTARGATIYTLSEAASDREAEALAQKENRSDIIAGVEMDSELDDVTNILIQLAQRETKNYSVSFTRAALAQMRGEVQINDNPHRFAPFRVLKAPDVPSVLIELGFVSNPKDEALLRSDAWRQKFAESLARAVEDYFWRRVVHSAPF